MTNRDWIDKISNFVLVEFICRIPNCSNFNCNECPLKETDNYYKACTEEWLNMKENKIPSIFINKMKKEKEEVYNFEKVNEKVLMGSEETLFELNSK